MSREKQQIIDEILEKVKNLISYYESDIITIDIDIKKSMNRIDCKIDAVDFQRTIITRAK